MSNAARRVLELFLRPAKQGVTGVTHVTGHSVTPKNQAVTMVTSVTYQRQHSKVEGVTSASASPAESDVGTGRRTRTAEHDDKLTRPRIGAGALALEVSIIQWLNRNPTPSPAGRCAWCGKFESESAVVLPFGFEPGSHAWLHGECWRPWHQARRAEAVKALNRVESLPDAATSART
jgi:hypothetical protein